MKVKTIFIFAYYSFQDPIFQSAVLPYFKGLGERSELRFVILTFEQQKYKMSSVQIDITRNELKKEQIRWFYKNWHSGKFKIVKKVFDFFNGILYSTYLIMKYKPAAIYSEGFPGAIIGHHLSRLFNLPHLIHTFEPHTDYMVEAGVWSEKSWEARLLRKYEMRVAKGASYIFTATNAMIEKLKSLNIKSKIYRVPSCVDLSLFNFSQIDRLKIRRKYAIQGSDCVITYLGKFGGMYMEEEIFDFFKICEEYGKINFKYFIITPDSHEGIFNYIESKNLDKSKFIVMTLQRNEISKFLSASDFGLVPVRQNPGKRYCSPIKDGEYWACGLPILIPKGISDDYIFARQYNIGLVIKDMDRESLEIVLQNMEVWLKIKNKDEVVKDCRDFVVKDRSIQKYKNLYREIFSKI